MLELKSKNDHIIESGLLINSEELSQSKIAELIREVMSRWGLSNKRQLLQHVRKQFKIAGIENTTQVSKVLNHLISLGELEEVYIDYESFLAPCDSKWIKSGNNEGTIIGFMNKSTKLKYLEKSYDNDVLWRFSISSDEDLTNLYLEGVDETTLEEWLKPVGYIPHKMRRLRCFTWNDKETLSDFWHILENEISSNGVLVNQDTKIRVINDEPGKYFGKYDSKEPEGRWSEKVTDGIWCGCRRGYNEKHWHRIIISVSGNERRALDLFDEDEWRWALLAKSFNKGYDEVVNISSDNEVDVTFPLPYQLENALSILGPKTGPWQWKLSPGAPNLFDYIH